MLPITQATNVFSAKETFLSASKKSQVGAKDYLSSLSPKQMCNRTFVVLTSTATGAGAGFIVGSAFPSIGQAAGAGAGAAIGFTAGVASVVTWDVYQFKKWKSQQKNNVVVELYGKIANNLGTSEYICPITKNPITTPVKSPRSSIFYEKEAIEGWITEYGTDPWTKDPLSIDELRVSAAALGGMNRVCQEMIEGKITHSDLTSIEVEGLKALREDCVKNIKNFFISEKDYLAELVKKNELSIQQFVKQMKAFADAVEPKKED